MHSIDYEEDLVVVNCGVGDGVSGGEDLYGVIDSTHPISLLEEDVEEGLYRSLVIIAGVWLTEDAVVYQLFPRVVGWSEEVRWAKAEHSAGEEARLAIFLGRPPRFGDV